MDLEKVYKDPDIKRYIKSKVKYDDVEDILQNSIIKLYKHKDKDIKNLKNYFFKIVQNEIFNYYKKNKVKLDELKDCDYYCDSDSNYSFIELKDLLNNYNMLYKHYFEGYSIEDLKKIYGMERSSIYAGIKREKEKFRGDYYGKEKG